MKIPSLQRVYFSLPIVNKTNIKSTFKGGGTMSVSVKGLDELMAKLETIASQSEIRKMEKEALKPVAEKIKSDLKSTAPVSTERPVHAVDYIDLKFNKGYKIGLDSSVDFDISRSLWFQNYATSYRTTHFHWFFNFIDENKNNYLDEARENLKKAIEQKLK